MTSLNKDLLYGLWIDLNRDGDWDDTGEGPFEAGFTTAVQPMGTWKIPVPANVTPGSSREFPLYTGLIRTGRIRLIPAQHSVLKFLSPGSRTLRRH